MTQIAFDAAAAVMRKISINVLGKDAENTLFTLPLEGIELSREELNALLGDRTFEAWYKQNKDKSYHPMDYWRERKNGDFESDAVFKCETCIIEVSGGKKIEFEMLKADENDPDSEEVPAAKAHSLVFKPMPGGITLLSLHLQVRPGVGKDNLALQNHQYRPVKVSLAGERKAGKADGAQGSLALGNGTPAGADTGEGARPVSGGFVQTKSAAEIDEEMRRRHPNASDADFEAGTRAQLAAFNAKPGEVVDGRSERVKHQDTTRGGGGRSRHR